MKKLNETINKTVNEALHEVYGDEDDWFAQDDWWEAEEPPKRISGKKLRKKYPHLKDVYDQYRMLKTLCRAEEESKK